jgi:FtsP/CotA-like multicopper oxidase with cupredoxin domain
VTASVLLALDLVAAIVTAGAWIAAAVLAVGLRPGGGAVEAAPAAAALPDTRRRVNALALVLLGLGALGVLAQGVVVVLLAAHGWWFVQEKVVFALPLAVVAAVTGGILAGRELLRGTRGADGGPGARGTAALVGAAAAGVAGIVARLVIGYPLQPVPALVLITLVLLCAALAWAVLDGRPGRVVTGLAAFSVLVLTASVGAAWLGAAALPGALAAAHHPAAAPPPTGSVPVTGLRTPADQAGPVRSFNLTAARQQVRLASGTEVSAWTYGSLPGPELRVTQGELVEVTLRNEDISDGVTIHWHGYDVPNGEDGVAGVTQDAVQPGESFTYRFATPDPGTYWYHTHQVSAEGVRRGLFGTLVVLPPAGVPETVDLTVPLHTLGQTVILGDSDGPVARTVAAGESVRVRLVNTDQVPHRFRVDGAPYTVVSADGRDLAGGTPVTAKSLRVPAGGRLDVSLTMPATGVRVTSNASVTATLTLGPAGVPPPPATDGAQDDLDLLHYGAGPGPAPAAGEGRVEATMVLDRHPRFLAGRPVYGYTVNGAVFPHIPSIRVSEGNRVLLTVVNRGVDTHPMHVHGHHVRVLSRDGVRSSGAPLWLDTFDVQPGEVWVVEFVADNPGIWLDHCHNLDHAAEGMMMALSYRGVTSPFEQGGAHDNRSE